jgi:hypothetical protein
MSKEPFGINKLREAYKSVFSTPHGQIVLFDILKRGFVFSPGVKTDSVVELSRNEGARQLALLILRFSKTSQKEIIRNYEDHIDSTA